MQKTENRAQAQAAYRIVSTLSERPGLPLLVYVAGMDGTGELFFKQAPALARSYRVVTFRSRERGRFTYDDLSDDVADIIRHMGEQRATIVAESFGGTVALAFALRYPEMVERLVIVNSFARYRRRIRIKLGARLAAVVPFRLTWIARKTFDTIGLMIDGVTREERKQVFDALHTVVKEGYVRRLQLIEEVDWDNRLAEIQAPILLIATKKDLLVPSIKEAHSMAAHMPNAQVKIIESAGHACLLGNQVCLAEILTEWIDK
ncbi:MAG TPA: alpha/beta hydrolase [Blastocatellia bacterium]|nr:alpha/beta hydrolase [Blastocatellia bacterium]